MVAALISCVMKAMGDAILMIFLHGACGLLIGNTQVYVGICRSILNNFLARLFSWDDLEDRPF